MTEGKAHVDIIANLNGNPIFLGHRDITPENYNHDRFRDIANLLHEIAWQLEDEASKFDGWKPRCLKNSFGDLYFEVAPDTFIAADDRKEAEVLFIANALACDEDELRSYYGNLQEVAE